MRTKTPAFTRPSVPLWIKVLIRPPTVEGIAVNAIYEVAQVRRDDAREAVEIKIRDHEGKLVGLLSHEFTYCKENGESLDA